MKQAREGMHERLCIGCEKDADVYCAECDHFFDWECYNGLHQDPDDAWIVLMDKDPKGRTMTPQKEEDNGDI